MRSAREDSRWWGGHGSDRNRLSLLDLVRNNTLDVATAALLWLLVEGKSSIVIAAAPQLAGKTTLLTALVDLVPPWFEKVYTRGQDEDFSFLQEKEPSNTYILVPQLSDHTPAYLWGGAVRKLFDALDRGYSFAATMHADSPEAVVAKLESHPLYIHRELVANLQAVVNLRLVYGEHEMRRRVNRLTIQVPDRSPAFVTLARWDPDGDAFRHQDTGEARSALCELLRRSPRDVGSDLAVRAETLRSWLDLSRVTASEFEQTVAQHYQHRKEAPN